MSNSAAVIISKTPTQNLTTAAGQKQKKIKAPVASCSHLSCPGPTSTDRRTLPTAMSPVSLDHQVKTVQSNNFSFLHDVKGIFLCLACQTKWNTKWNYHSFFKHIWEKHNDGADFSCCPTGYSPYCARLGAIVKTIYDKSQQPMPDQIRSYLTPKSPIKTENEDVWNISSSEGSSSAPVPSMVETVKQINVSESPSSTLLVQPSSGPRECDQSLLAESVSLSSDSSSPPMTLVPDQHRHMIETEQNYDFGALAAGNKLEQGAQNVQESATQIGKRQADRENVSSASELRDDLNFNNKNLQNITAIDLSSSVASSSVNEESNNRNTYEDISDDDSGGINYHNHGTGSIHYSLFDSPYSDELPLDLSEKKETQPEKSHNNVTVTPLLAVETAAVISVTDIEKLSSERINNSHNNFTITPLSAAKTAVTSCITKIAVTSSIIQTVGLLPESIRNAHNSFTVTPLSATETEANPRTLTERLETSLAASSDIDAVSHVAYNMCQSEFADLDQLGLHLQKLLLKATECKHCASLFLNISSCYERKMRSNVPQQSSQEDIQCLPNVERDAETSDYQCEGTYHESHATSGVTANVLDETETTASNVIEHCEVRSKDVKLTGTYSHHEERDMADGIEAQATHEHISKIPNLLDLVKTSAATRSFISDVSLNAGKVEQSAVAITGPNRNERRGNSVAQQCESGTYITTINERRRGNSVAQQCESGTYTTTINERRGSVDVDLHELMGPVSSHGNDELREIAPDLTAIKASMDSNEGLMQIENSGNMEEYVQPVFKTSTSIDSSNSVKYALSHAEDNPTNTLLDYEDQSCQGVVAEIPLGVQSSSRGNFGQIVSENIGTMPYNKTVPLNDHCLNEKAKFSVVGQAEAVREPRVKHTSPSVVGNIDASSDLVQTTSVESQDGCVVTAVSSSDAVSCKLPQASDCSVGSKDYFNITSTDLLLPITRVSDFASTSAANFNLDMIETRTILCASEQKKLEYTESTCLPVEDIGADIDNRQESSSPKKATLKDNTKEKVPGTTKRKRQRKKETDTDDEEEEVHVHPFRKFRKSSYMSLATLDDDDDFLYCEHCRQDYDGDCPVHGPLLVVDDVEEYSLVLIAICPSISLGICKDI